MMTQVAATLSKCAGVNPPEASGEAISLVTNLADHTFGAGKKPDRMLIYNPDAIAMWLYQKYTNDFMPVLEKTQLAVPVQTVLPSVTPVCFGTMYTGVMPSVHGIQTYEKHIINHESFFDVLSREHKKTAIVAVEDSSMAIIFGGRAIDYYLLPYDQDVNQKAEELIKQDEYEVIVVYNQEYDDVMHDTYPESEVSMAALKHHIEAFSKLTDAVLEHWSRHDSMVSWITDHGIHTDEHGKGDHGTFMEDDLNVMHFYGAYAKT